MKLNEYLDINELTSLINNGFITVREHDEFPLRILNYAKKAAGIRNDKWPDALLKSRGLIVDNDDNIVAMGMRKFWNVERTTWLKKPLIVADKLDGSLGVVYVWKGVPYIATRGSFHSEMADWANKFLDENLDYRQWLYNEPVVNSPLTPHVEIIFNANRIVVDYDYEDLVLLGYNDDRSWTPAQQEWTYPGRIAQSFQFDSLKEIFKSEYRPNAEGFVILDSAGQMKKYKYEEYLALHKAVSNMTERAIYNKMVTGDVDEFILSLPDEFQDEAQSLATRLRSAYNEKRKEFYNARVLIQVAEKQPGRKGVALHMQETNVPGWIRACVFAYLDNNMEAIEANIWKQVKP